MSLHIPILLKESILHLNLKEGDIVVDATTNRGGHSLEIAKQIKKQGTLICLDLDNQALLEAEKFLKENLDKNNLPKIFFINENFKNLENVLKDLKIKKINSLLADLGISSQELDISGRGFTFQKDEPLQMTLKDKIEEDLTAEKIVNLWEEENIADIIFYYSDERFAKRIARVICEERKKKYIKTTFDLVEIIKKALPIGARNGKIHFATKTFQGLRIAVNDELQNEEKLLNSLKNILIENGRASILTFHSGEERVVKGFIKKNKKDFKLLKFTNKKDFLEPDRIEIKNNPRSRSSKLRVIEKIN